MNRHMSFLVLLAIMFALAGNRLEAQRAPGAAEPPRTEPAPAKTEPAPAQAEKAQKPAEQAQVKTEPVPAKTEAVQAETEKAPGQTEEAQPQTAEDAKLTSVPGGKALGMSILGNQEAPKSLVIVPWKTSELGRSPGIAPMLDDSRQPVDKEVFLRALRYYEIRSGAKPKP